MILYASLIATLFALFYFVKCKDFNSIIILAILSLVIINMFNIQNTENFTATEALANISSMYNQGTLTCSNLNVTNSATFNGDVMAKGKLSVVGDTALGPLQVTSATFNGDVMAKGKLSVVGDTALGPLQVTGDTNAVIKNKKFRMDLFFKGWGFDAGKPLRMSDNFYILPDGRGSNYTDDKFYNFTITQ